MKENASNHNTSLQKALYSILLVQDTSCLLVVYLPSWRDDRFGIDSIISLNNKIPRHEWRKEAYITGSILIMDQF